MADLFSDRVELARAWLQRTATSEHGGPALRILEAIADRTRPSEADLGWLAGRALDGVLAARICLGVL